MQKCHKGLTFFAFSHLAPIKGIEGVLKSVHGFGFTLFHWSAVGGSDVQRSVATRLARKQENSTGYLYSNVLVCLFIHRTGYSQPHNVRQSVSQGGCLVHVGGHLMNKANHSNCQPMLFTSLCRILHTSDSEFRAIWISESDFTNQTSLNIYWTFCHRWSCWLWLCFTQGNPL